MAKRIDNEQESNRTGARIGERRWVLLAINAGITILWMADLIYRWLHLQEKLNERPTLLWLAKSCLTETILTLMIVDSALYVLYEKISFLRPSIPRRETVRNILHGVFWGILIFAIATFVTGPLLYRLHPELEGETSALTPLFRDLGNLPLWILLAVVGGGFIEELQRVFALRLFEEGFGRKGLWAAFVLSSVVFAFGHLYQGVNNAINIGLTGVAYALLYMRRRDPLVSMVAHGTFDLIGVGLGFFLFHGS